MLNKCILILLLSATVITQLPEDDLVTATFPNYTHNIYSGNTTYIQAIWTSESFKPKSPFTMYYCSLKIMWLRIPLLYGLQEALDVQV